jgi:hypothetical protein
VSGFAGVGDRLRVLALGADVQGSVPHSVGGRRVDVVYRTGEVVEAAERSGADVVLAGEDMAEIAAHVQPSQALALVQSSGLDRTPVSSGLRFEPAPFDLVEVVLAIASVRVCCVADS